MTEKVKKLVTALRNSYDYSERRDAESADLIVSMSKQLDDQNEVIDRIYEQCKTLQNDLKELGYDSIADMYAQLEQVTRERDAALRSLKRGYRACSACRYGDDTPENNEVCSKCRPNNEGYSEWQWQGVEVEG